MGAVRRLATVVIVGLVALSTVMVVYLAAEPTRRESETDQQGNTSIVRGTELYITYCLQCHGPAGLGSAAEEEPRRTGAPLNQDFMNEQQRERARVIYQSDDPVMQAMAEDWIRFRITYGVPGERPPGFDGEIRMPAFGADLNVEEMNELVYLIMHGDWNYVYNQAVQQDDGSLAYPTVPPVATEGSPEAEDASDVAEEATPESGGDASAEGGLEIEAFEMGYSETEITVQPGDTITMTNTGVLEHDFTVDELGIHEVTPTGGDTVTITIPEDAEAGEYEFYCSVAGHKEAGMLGTLTVEAP